MESPRVLRLEEQRAQRFKDWCKRNVPQKSTAELLQKLRPGPKPPREQWR